MSVGITLLKTLSNYAIMDYSIMKDAILHAKALRQVGFVQK